MTRLRARARDTAQGVHRRGTLHPDQGEKTQFSAPIAVPFGFLLLWPLDGVAAESFTLPGGPEGSNGQLGAGASSPLLVCASNRFSGSGSRLVIQGSFQNYLVFLLQRRSVLIPSTKVDFL